MQLLLLFICAFKSNVRLPSCDLKISYNRSTVKAYLKMLLLVLEFCKKLTISPPTILWSAELLICFNFQVLQSCPKLVKMLSECQTAWTQCLIQMQAGTNIEWQAKGSRNISLKFTPLNPRLVNGCKSIQWLSIRLWFE